MKTAFQQNQALRNNVRTSTFPWSHVNNFTTEIGRITPIFCNLVPFKGSVKIPVTLAIQSMPMVFPIQTRMLAKVSFFRYPLRALWKDYRDYQGNYKQGLEEPFHDFASISNFGTCSLFDYLGLPTTVATTGQSNVSLPAITSEFFYGKNQAEGAEAEYIPFGNSEALARTFTSFSSSYLLSKDEIIVGSTDGNITSYIGVSGESSVLKQPLPYNYINTVYYSLDISGMSSAVFNAASVTFRNLKYAGGSPGNTLAVGVVVNDVASFTSYRLTKDEAEVSINLSDINGVDDDKLKNAKLVVAIDKSAIGYVSNIMAQLPLEIVPNNNQIYSDFSISFLNTSSEVKDVDRTNHVWYASDNSGRFGTKGLKISAYGARAYEGVFNAFFRNIQNDPYYVNGQVEYNQFIPTMDGGVDDYNYSLHYMNWERDVFTTALQSPQQGQAPLVGLTTYTDYTTAIENEDGSITYRQNLALTDEDGNSYGVDFKSDDDGLTDVVYTKLGSDVQVGKVTRLIDLASSGISIQDLRNVNAYQRYLELNIRANYTYKQIVENRFNVKIRYSDLLMPEYLGGFTQELNMRGVTQTVDNSLQGSYDGALGSQAGIAYSMRQGRDITVYCDEESIVLGLCTIVPIPVYSQFLPKHFLYRELLDHFTPEFNNIGYQPILNRELAPLQCSSVEELNGVFGYQRPWYEYLSMLDQAHGLYRTTMRNFLMQRTFGASPVLGRQFLQINPEDVNDVFSVTQPTDKFYGQVYIGALAKLPIPRVSIPRLE